MFVEASDREVFSRTFKLVMQGRVGCSPFALVPCIRMDGERPRHHFAVETWYGGNVVWWKRGTGILYAELYCTSRSVGTLADRPRGSPVA